MALYRVTAEYYIRSTPKHARKKAERLLAKAGLPPAPDGGPGTRVVRVTKLTGRREPRRGVDRYGLQRRRTSRGTHISVELLPFQDGRTFSVGQVWAVVKQTLECDKRMPAVIGNKRKRIPCAYPWSWKIELPVQSSVRSCIHEFAHCVMGRDDGGLWHGRDFADAERACVAVFEERHGVSFRYAAETPTYATGTGMHRFQVSRFVTALQLRVAEVSGQPFVA